MRRSSMRPSDEDGPAPIPGGHASLSSIFDLSAVATPVATRPAPPTFTPLAGGIGVLGAVGAAGAGELASGLAAAQPGMLPLMSGRTAEGAAVTAAAEATAVGTETETVNWNKNAAAEEPLSTEDVRVTIAACAEVDGEVRLTIKTGRAGADDDDKTDDNEKKEKEEKGGKEASNDAGSLPALPPPVAIPRRKSATVTFAENDVTDTFAPSPRPPTPTGQQQQFSDSWVMDKSGPSALNRIIYEKSSDAQLVIVNLPDPDAIVMQNPSVGRCTLRIQLTHSLKPPGCNP